MTEKEQFKKDFAQRLVRFSLAVIHVCSNQSGQAFRIINDQLIRSATSIGANVIEAKASSSRRDYIKFFEIALKSANETIYWLILCRELQSKPELVHDLIQESGEITKILSSSVLTLKGKK